MRWAAALTLMLAAGIALVTKPPTRRVVQLPAGLVEVHFEIVVDGSTELAGARSGTLLHAAPDFQGRAVVVVHGEGARLRDFAIDGNREAFERRSGLPDSGTPFARFTTGNGVLVEKADGVTVERLQLREISGFAILVTASRDVTIDGVQVTDSGSRTAQGHNNATGGILLEEGTSDFRVVQCRLWRIRGNGLWTHSLYTSPRNARGIFSGNSFDTLGRDAIQVGHATGVRVSENYGSHIGFPLEDVNMEDLAVPTAIDTAGNVDHSQYLRNRFEEIDGKCIDLDGFHDGEIRENICRNRAAPEHYRFGNYGIVMNNSNPDMQSRNIRMVENVVDGALFGGIFVIGSGHQIARNRLLNLNTAHCNEGAARFGCYYAAGEPDMLRSGIYLGRGAARPDPAHDNRIEDNVVTGFGMKERCIGLAPGIPAAWNLIRGNQCSN